MSLAALWHDIDGVYVIQSASVLRCLQLGTSDPVSGSAHDPFIAGTPPRSTPRDDTVHMSSRQGYFQGRFFGVERQPSLIQTLSLTMTACHGPPVGAPRTLVTLPSPFSPVLLMATPLPPAPAGPAPHRPPRAHARF